MTWVGPRWEVLSAFGPKKLDQPKKSEVLFKNYIGQVRLSFLKYKSEFLSFSRFLFLAKELLLLPVRGTAGPVEWNEPQIGIQRLRWESWPFWTRNPCTVQEGPSPVSDNRAILQALTFSHPLPHTGGNVVSHCHVWKELNTLRPAPSSFLPRIYQSAHTLSQLPGQGGLCLLSSDSVRD